MNKLQGLNTKTYLTRSLLDKIFNKTLSNDEVDELVLSGQLVKKYSYYQPTVELLRELGILPERIKVVSLLYSKLAKNQSFVLKDIKEIFGGCHIDVARLLAERYFYRKYNYFYKNDLMNEKLSEGCEEFEI